MKIKSKNIDKTDDCIRYFSEKDDLIIGFEKCSECEFDVFWFRIENKFNFIDVFHKNIENIYKTNDGYKILFKGGLYYVYVSDKEFTLISGLSRYITKINKEMAEEIRGFFEIILDYYTEKKGEENERI